MPHQVFARRPDKIYLHNYYHDVPALLCTRNLQHRRPEPWCAPRRIARNSTHLLRPQSARPGAGAEMNHTRSLPTESSHSMGKGNTHIDYSSPAWLGTSAQIQGERQAGLKRGQGIFSIRVRVKNKAKSGAPWGHLAASALIVVPLPVRAPWSPSLSTAGLSASPLIAVSSFNPRGALSKGLWSGCSLRVPLPSSPCQQVPSSLCCRALPEWRGARGQK